QVRSRLPFFILKAFGTTPTVARQRPGSGIISYRDVGHGSFSMMLFTLFYENDPYVSQEDTMLFQ
ncbi:hypothetical protein, partial [Shouchella clausii]|uniref:hypothetical protein n=1 Tax=Shouchella clausii TaxID=79880 RepID=UPI00289B65AF